jgi:hypothetical protein
VYTTSVPINDTIEIVEQMNDKISSTMSSCPVVLFVVCNIISFVIGDESADGYLGYGGEMCYIENSKMILFTFVIPVGFILLSNTVTYVHPHY